MMLAFILFISTASQSQVIVRVRPVIPVLKVRPACPAPGHVWVGGNYIWRGGQYVYVDGYWAKPPRGHHRWVDGRWKHRRGGWVWIPGHWR